MQTPELLAGTPGELDADRQTIVELLARVAAGPRDGPGPAHPLFGSLSRKQWAVLGYRHIDHHLRQFGV